MTVFIGIEYGVKYTLTGPDGTVAVFNDSMDKNFVGILSPESSGLDSPDVRESAADATEADGGVHGNFYYGRRPIVLQGTIIAKSADERNERAGRLQQASNAVRGDATLKWIANTYEEVSVSVRRQQPLRITKGFVKDFQLSLVAADPRIYSAVEKVAFSKGVIETKAATSWKDLAGSGGSKVWGTPVNAAASDNAYATVVLAAAGETGISHWIVGKELGFALPAGAFVTNWGYEIERHASSAGSTFKRTTKHTNESEEPTGTGQTTTDTIGTGDENKVVKSTIAGVDGLTAAIVNNSKFGIAMFLENTSGAERTYSLDRLAMSVTYIVNLMEIENFGSIETFPIIELMGPITGPVTIKNVTTGAKLVINISGLVSTETLRVNTLTRTIVAGLTGEEKNAYNNLVFAESTWFGLAPGATIIEFTGTGAASATKFTVRYKNAWI